MPAALHLMLQLLPSRRPADLDIQGGSNMTGTDLRVNKPHCAAAVRPTETLFPILLLESVVNFSGRNVFSNEEFDHNAFFHAPQYLLFAHHSSNSQTGLNRF